MLMRVDPLREFDKLVEAALSDTRRSDMAALDAYRHGDEFVVQIDLPGVDPDAIDVTVERNQLTVTAERHRSWDDGDMVAAAERSHGRFTRQLFLGEGLDTDRISAAYEHGVLTLHIPVAEAAKPRKVEVTSASSAKAIETTGKEADESRG
ncbi:MAG: hypothetical protein KatS3mg008_1398 [Acidimicrobiales bacterium]|nr:MAG: hypothetical protein KatS3mg008_1398 [Acidimicrobiales bacterium]